MNKYEEIVVKFFDSINMKAEKIAEYDEKTPDFLLADYEKILVELKVKLDTKDDHKEMAKILADNDVFSNTEKIKYTGKIANIIKLAVKQLKSQKQITDSKFCFLFIIADGISPTSQLKQLEMTLYGAKAVSESSSVQTKYCYYFGESQFFRYRNILDGVFVGNLAAGKVSLFLNNLSENYNELLNSSFLNALRKCVPIIDPVELEHGGQIYMITENIDRKNENLVQQHLFSKYEIENGCIMEFENNTFTVNV